MKAQSGIASVTLFVFGLGAVACSGAQGSVADNIVDDGSQQASQAPEGAIADGQPTLVAEVASPTGSQVQFFVDDSGGADIVERGDTTMSSALNNPELENATALEIYYALSEPDASIPSQLWDAAQLADQEGAIERRGLMERSQGWLITGEQAALQAAAPPECASDAAFNSGICTGAHDCALNQTGPTSMTASRILSYRALLCNSTGSGSTSFQIWYRSQPLGNCTLGSWVQVGNWQVGPGIWLNHVKSDTFPGRQYYIAKGSGGRADIGHRYTQGNCIL